MTSLLFLLQLIYMEHQQETPKFRPNEHEFSQRIHYVRESKVSDPDAYETYATEIPLYASGQGDKETREQFYPGWTDEDFQILLEKLRQEGLIEN